MPTFHPDDMLTFVAEWFGDLPSTIQNLFRLSEGAES
jgi:hypothetical protein